MTYTGHDSMKTRKTLKVDGKSYEYFSLPEAAKKILEATGGPIYGAVDLVGAADTATLALNSLRKGGKLIVVGLYGGEIPVSLVLVVQRAWRIQGSSVGNVAELKEVIAMARAGKIKPIPIEKRPLSEVSRTLDQLKAGSIVGRVVAAHRVQPRVSANSRIVRWCASVAASAS